MKQILLSLIRPSVRRPVAAPAPRELGRSELKQVVGGESTDSPRTGW